jgi:Holliday junction resolvase RusA-like endonuclease
MDDNILFKSIFKISKHGILKNSKQILFNKKTNQHFIAKSSQAMSIEKELCMRLTLEKYKSKIDTITCDVGVSIIFYFPKTVCFTKKGVRSQKLPDLDNLIAMPLDCLQKTGIIKNDTQICALDHCRRAPTDSTEYALAIKISKFID